MPCFGVCLWSVGLIPQSSIGVEVRVTSIQVKVMARVEVEGVASDPKTTLTDNLVTPGSLKNQMQTVSLTATTLTLAIGLQASLQHQP